MKRKIYVFELFKEIWTGFFPIEETPEQKAAKKSVSEKFGINAPSYLDEEDYIEDDTSHYKKEDDYDER